MNIVTKAGMRNFAVIRDVIAETEAKMKEMIENVKQSDEYAAMENWLIINKQSLVELDAAIREAAIEDYKVTGNKKPWDGVGIRELTKYDYELADAVAWAKANASMVVYETVDKKKFEKILSVTEPETLPETIKVYKEAIATIASDLSMYLEDEDES